MDKMTKKEAEEYLKKKGKPITQENIDKVMQEGKIYGDPKAYVKF